MSELAVKIARLLLPNDTTTDNGIPTLLKAMSNNMLSKKLTLPDEKYNKTGYVNWTKNQTVIAIKSATTQAPWSFRTGATGPACFAFECFPFNLGTLAASLGMLVELQPLKQ